MLAFAGDAADRRCSTCSAACWPASARSRTSPGRRSSRTSSRPERLRPALALNFGLYQLTLVIGPALGGLLIAALGVGAAYAVDAVELPGDGRRRSWRWRRSRRTARRRRPSAPIRRSIAEGLRFVRGNQALMGSFAIDLLAMTFGMPRALFPVLAVSVYGAGADGHRPAVRRGRRRARRSPR